MAVTVDERASSQTRVDVRIVDCDLHPAPRAGELAQYIPEPYRSEFWARRRVGQTNTYDAPDYYRAQAMRLDSFPEDGDFPGSDPDLTFRHVIMEAGCDIVILEPLRADQHLPGAHAVDGASRPTTGSTTTGSTARTTGTSAGAARSASRSRTRWARVREIEHWAGHPCMAQVMINAEPRPAWGDPRYDPIWAAATSARPTRSPATSAAGSSSSLPMPPVGLPHVQPRLHGHLLAARGEPGDEPDLRRRLRAVPDPPGRPRRARVQLDPAADVADGRDLRGAQGDLPHLERKAVGVRLRPHLVHDAAARLPGGPRASSGRRSSGCRPTGCCCSRRTTRTGRSTTRSG